MDMARMDAAALHDVDPQTVEPERLCEIEGTVLRKGGDVAVQRLDQIGEDRIALGQVVERGVGGVAAIAVRLGPSLAGAIILGERAAAMVELVQQRIVREHALVESGGEKAARGHDAAIGSCPRLANLCQPSDCDWPVFEVEDKVMRIRLLIYSM